MSKKHKAINIKGLMKIGQENHINDLHKKGVIFCNTIKFFKTIETADKNRRDEREGAYRTEVLNPDHLSMSVKGEKIPITFTSFRLNLFDNEIEQHKLYCMYGFKERHITGKPFVDAKNLEFGDKALIVFNTEEFVNRIKNKLESKGLEYLLDYVSYYKEENVNENLSVFHKPTEFSYQSEFRFYVKHEKPTPLILKIGSIEDISVILDSDTLPKLNLKPLTV